ncbi:copper amine oxidase N-terminal domain-containing protein [Aneurinibacillus tyrosinisolvens]|uniref:copper amine oxidase N-terminal domain-containing protein n=1 Tax=Aneurinibacillus tyrosinisolvens TaxID=1443435 RepID=UPI00063F73A9|nr:copper amine oxidase N-terminal domain-containing protein [Aneurinibacillus tyrosinisolvens]
MKKIGSIAIEESVKASLQANRTINLTLSGNAKWGSLSDFRYDDSQSKNKNTAVINPGGAQIIGSDKKTLRLTVANASSDALKAVLKDAKINVSPDATGDIKLTVSGSANLTGDLTVAKVVKPVDVKVDGALPNIQIGQQAQPIGDVTLTEAAAEAIDHSVTNGINNNLVALIFPEGVTPTLPTSVQVTDGDLSIDTGSATKVWNNNRWEIRVTTRSTSTKPSALKFSGMKVTVDRTVPEGPIAVKVGGNALVQTQGQTDFPGVDSVTSVDVANVGTPAAGKGSSAFVAFKLGATTYTVDGAEKTMDVAPFAENNRTFLPIRFAADALGAQNVQWDQATRTVTVFKNGNIVQMVLGKKEYKLNGVSVPMDVAVQAKNGRVVLPIRFLGDALNVPVQYDESTGAISLGTPAVK